MLVIHTACLAFVVLLFGTTFAAPVPPQPGALLHNDDLGGGSGDATASMVVLQARRTPAVARKLRTIKKYRLAAKIWREGNHPDRKKKAEALDEIAKHHGKPAKPASEEAARDSEKLADDAIAQARLHRPWNTAEKEAIRAHEIAGDLHRDTTWSVYSQDDSFAQGKAAHHATTAEGHEKCAKNPYDGYKSISGSLDAARKSSKKANQSIAEAVEYNKQVKGLFDAAMKAMTVEAGSHH